jgi:hypothetical protein
VPRATVTVADTETFKLKSCPGGEIELRRMTYGQKLARQQNAVKTTVQQDKGSGRNSTMNLDMLQHAATVFDFRACIVSHNLEDETGKPLNLTQVVDIDRLDPRVGEEISKYIDEMNNFEEDMEEAGFPSGSELP